MRYLLALALAGVLFSVKAQEITPLDPGRLVEMACVGECGEIDVMNYRVPAYAGDERMTFMVENYQLCRNSTAAGTIAIDGKEIDRFTINPQTMFSFVAPSGSSVRVAVKAKVTDPTVLCCRQGGVTMNLYAVELVGVDPNTTTPRPRPARTSVSVTLGH